MAAFDLRRATRDVDLLALRTENDPAVVASLVAEVASIEVEDGVMFLVETVATDLIRDDDIYPGVRVALDARLATARIKFSVDLNVGDPVVPGSREGRARGRSRSAAASARGCTYARA